MQYRSVLKKIFTPFVVIVAFAYFLLDILFEVSLRPVNRWLASLRIFEKVTRFIQGLGPYTTLVLFLVPLIVLEPAKPFGLFLIATGHHVMGIAFIVVGDLLKIIFVERLFQIGRPKLMTIPAFAKTFNYLAGWLHWLSLLPAWVFVRTQFRLMGQWVRSIFRKLRDAL